MRAQLVLFLKLVFVIAIEICYSNVIPEENGVTPGEEVINESTGCPYGWVPYIDEKCFKLVKEYKEYKKAEQHCAQIDRSFEATLATIKSRAEHRFLIDYIFGASSVKVNLWIGLAYNRTYNKFTWIDGSDVEYSKWAIGHPITPNDPQRECVQMQSSLTRDEGVPPEQPVEPEEPAQPEQPEEPAQPEQPEEPVEPEKPIDVPEIGVNGGEWKDVTCELPNYYVCQTLQVWTFNRLQRAFIDLRDYVYNNKK